MTLILIDNYDSFTYNLVQYFGDLGVDVSVYRNDQIKADEVIAQAPKGLVISPGPSDPDHAGICLELTACAAKAQIPLLGVCLGHQTIGQAFGGRIIRAEPMHGKISKITHDEKGLFEGLPSPLDVTRYHSLVIERASIPECLTVTAETGDGLIMGVAHKDLPIFGVQFHPESIATQNGIKILQNFITGL
jgi:anthranilate synthase component 2